MVLAVVYYKDYTEVLNLRMQLILGHCEKIHCFTGNPPRNIGSALLLITVIT